MVCTTKQTKKELDQRREIEVTFIDEILALSKNIHQTYIDAPDFLKRHYLRFFFEKFMIKEKVIEKVVLSPLFSVLVQENLGYIKTCSAPRVGFEPTTLPLTGARSTTELPRNI